MPTARTRLATTKFFATSWTPASPPEPIHLVSRSANHQIEWCCSNAEQCANSQGQINVCATKFPDPNANITVADAVQAEYKALGVTTVTSTLSAGQSFVSGSPTAFTSTIVATGTSTSSSFNSTSTASSSSVASASKNQASASAVTPAPASPTVPTSDARSGLAGGAIAGVVIGVIAVVGIVAAVYWCMRTRRTRRRNQWSIPDIPGKMSEAPDTALFEAQGREKPAEIGGDEARHEMA